MAGGRFLVLDCCRFDRLSRSSSFHYFLSPLEQVVFQIQNILFKIIPY